MKLKKNSIEKIESISQCPLFRSLSKSEIESVAEYSDICIFEKNETVFRSGSNSGSLYLILQGKIIVKKADEYGKEKIVADYRTGNYFGEIDLFTEIPHSESTYSLEESQLLLFPKENYSISDFFQMNPFTGTKILQKVLVEISQRIRSVNNLIKNNSPVVEMLRNSLYTDSLTGLNNETFLKEQMNEHLSSGKSFSIVSFKPDNFKEINDRFGHDAGDRTIKIIASTLNQSVPDNFIATRRAGNEHSVLINFTDKKKLRTTVKKLQNEMTNCDLSPVIKDEVFQLSISFGIARSNIVKNVEEMLRISHELTLKGRGEGGNKILFEDGNP